MGINLRLPWNNMKILVMEVWFYILYINKNIVFIINRIVSFVLMNLIMMKLYYIIYFDYFLRIRSSEIVSIVKV